MNADDLRACAREIRETANAATPGPWRADVLGSEGYAVTEQTYAKPLRRPVRVARCGYESWDTDKGNAEHLAAWHPDVALAVADLLDEAAAMRASGFNVIGCTLADRIAEAWRGERP
jgi:hypothetical protein